MNEPKRYLGLELTGARNFKTTVAVLEYFPKEKKIFVLDVQSGLGGSEGSSSDQVLVETLVDHAEGHHLPTLAANAAMSLPPCVTCTRKSCPGAQACTVPAVKWMRNFYQKKEIERDLTPYTQRPVELFLKHDVICELPQKLQFEMDETLGGNRAPLSARMNHLRFQLEGKFQFLEVHPKLSLGLMGLHLKLPARLIGRTRDLEDGAYCRDQVLTHLCEEFGIFIYDRDQKKIAESLNAFDALILALSAWWIDNKGQVKAPKGFPADSGWISIPDFGAES